jgi:hypothetical protein
MAFSFLITLNVLLRYFQENLEKYLKILEDLYVEFI